MSIRNGRDYIYLVWQENKTRRRYVIGQLSKNGQYEFNYGFEVNEAIDSGFKLLIGFDDINEVYKNDILFPVFSSRLPDRKRKGIDKILQKYGLDEFDEYKLLKRSGAKLPIDNLEFIDPIFEDETEIKRNFYLAGTRYCMECNGDDCMQSIDVEIYEALKLENEPENKHDNYAIKVLDSKDNHIGYIPRYYSEQISELLKNKYKYNCTVSDVQKDNNCNECIKVELVLK